MLPETYRIPLDAAHSILATFGITSPTKQYERWVKPEGFDVRDFGSVLFESPFIFVIDWRASLDEELETVANALLQLDTQVDVDVDEETGAGHVECNGRRAPVAHDISDDSSLDNVFRALQSIMPKHLEFRASPLSEGSDTAMYAVLPRDEWAELERTAASAMAHFFKPLDAGHV
jgi:hypothetical protein